MKKTKFSVLVVDLCWSYLFYVTIKQYYNSVRKLNNLHETNHIFLFNFFCKQITGNQPNLHLFKISFWPVKCCTACSVCYATSFHQLSAFKDLINSQKELIKCSATVQRKASCFFGLPVTSLSVHTSSSSLLLPGHWASQPGLSSSCSRLCFFFFFFCWETEVY